MAVLALAGVGAAAAAGIGWAAGLTGAALLTAGSIGFSVGNIAGNLLFPQRLPDVRQEGARLGDLTVSTSTYGNVIPFGVGHARLAGNVIWAKAIEETKTTTTQRGGGKGGKSRGGSVTQTTYTYAGTFAVAFCEGPVAAVIRIWANNTLIYDASTGTDSMQTEGLRFRFYPGDEAQLPDSLIEADQGAGNVPAFRGLCYLVFDHLPLAEYGNRLPNIQVELAFGVSDRFDYGIIAGGTGPTIASGFKTTTLAINPVRQRGYVLGTGPNTIVEFDLVTMAIVSERKLSDILGNPDWDSETITSFDHLYVAHDQNLYFTHGTWLYKINPFAWTLKTATISLPNALASHGALRRMTSLAFIGDTGLKTIVVVHDALLRSTVYFYDTQNEAFVDTRQFSSGSNIFGGGVSALTVGLPGEGAGEAWAIGAGGGSVHDPVLYVDKLTAGQYADVGLLGYSIEQYTGCENKLALDIADVDPGAIGWLSSTAAGVGAVYDETDNSLIILAPAWTGATVRPWLIKWSEADGIVWTTRLTTLTGTSEFMFSKVSGGKLGILLNQTLVMVDTATGAVTLSDWSSIGWHPTGIQAFSHQANAIIVASATNTDWRKLLVQRVSPSTASMAQFVTRVMDGIHVDAADYDVTDLDAITIDGFLVSQRTSAADAIRPLATLFQIDAVETDNKLVFKRRGGATVVSIAQDDLIRPEQSGAGSEPYTAQRTQEIELPAKVTVSYIDVDQDFQVNTQAAQRVRSPVPTIRTDHQVDLQVALATNADTARQQAEVLLYSAWLERHSFQFLLPPAFAYLDPADPVQLTLANGYTVRGRLGAVELGANYASSTTLLAETDGQYVSTAAGAVSAGILPQAIATSAPSQLFLLDVPLLRPTDDIGLQGMRVYWAVAPYVATGAWHGAQLQSSYDLTAWDGLDVSVHAAAWGYLEAALPDANDIFHTLHDASVTAHVSVGGDTLESVTETQLANGFNAAAVFKDNGDIEIIQFLDVADLGGNRHMLTGLNRGVSGTDTMAAGHATGERILFLSTLTVNPLIVPLLHLNRQGYFRPVSAGTLANTAIIEPHRFMGRDKMPLAPVHVTATLAGGDISLTWERRTRVNGGLMDGTGTVPVGEASEAYEVDIIAADGTTVLRTLTASTTAVTYAATDIAADFGVTPAELHVAVYQISAEVGRGFGRIDLLEVA